MTDSNSGAGSGASGDVTFATFDDGLRRWGKYDRFPNKLHKATEVFDKLAAQLGLPEQIIMLGSRRYVRAIWDEPSRVLYCHSTFMSWNLRPDDSWVPGQTPGRWEYRFPDFVLVSRPRAKKGPALGSCDCMPGVQHPVGTDCPYCDEPITA